MSILRKNTRRKPSTKKSKVTKSTKIKFTRVPLEKAVHSEKFAMMDKMLERIVFLP